MSDPYTPRLAYFETDQIKYAVQLWKCVKKALGNDFDVLKFSQNWTYADDVLARCLIADSDEVSNRAVDLTQLRLCFIEQFPERARKMGAIVSGASPRTGSASIRTAGVTLNAARSAPEQGQAPDASTPRYLKGLR